MATKSANLYARIEPDVKEQAESILSALGIPASNAINMFYKQIILNRGLPFEVKIPTTKPVNVAELTEAELNAELEEGYADMVAGRTKPADNAAGQLDRLEEHILGLEEFPEKYRLYGNEPWHSRGLRVMPVDNYLVFYIPDKDTGIVTVIRVMYEGRNVENQLNNHTVI